MAHRPELSSQGRTDLKRSKKRVGGIRYVPTGIPGFDEITGGGLPAGRTTVVLGGAGGGKTIFGAQVLVVGARDFGEPGILVSFEESARQVIENTASFAWGIDRQKGKDIDVVDARLSQSVVRGGEFDLLGLLAVLGQKVKTIRAKRIVLDGLDVLLANLGDPSLMRREVFRLREWLADSGLTAIVTAKADAADMRPSPEYDFLQFMADCVVKVQDRVVGGTALRFIRVTKCRGGPHSANEFPFTIGPAGIEVGAGAVTDMVHPASKVRVSTGVERLDAMLGGGYYRGSSTLITGSPGTSKTTLCAAFAEAASRRKDRTLFVSFDEAPEQVVRNMESVGIALGSHLQSGVLRMHSLRSQTASPEAHVAKIRHFLREHRAINLVVDPLSALGSAGGESVAQRAAIEILDLAKTQGITSIYTSLLGGKAVDNEETPTGISTIADTWMHVTYVKQGGERNRALTVIKSRGTNQSNQIRELVLSKDGVTLADVYSADGEVLMGTLRWQRENDERRKRDAAARDADIRRKKAELAVAESKTRTLAALDAQAVDEAILERVIVERNEMATVIAAEGVELLRRRGADRLRTTAGRLARKPLR
jgi:circadian clock protein KaiC